MNPEEKKAYIDHLAKEPGRQVFDFEIVEDRIAEFEHKMELLSRRALRLGLPTPEYMIDWDPGKRTREVIESEDYWGVRTRQIIMRRPVRVVGDRPMLKGWTFVGTIQHEPGGAVLKAAPDQNMPKRFREADPICDHCGYRRIRNETFVLSKPGTGRIKATVYKQVGRRCMQDYLGDESTAFLRRYEFQKAILEAGAEFERDAEGGGAFRSYMDLKQFLTFTARAVEKDGWTSRGKAREDLTGKTTATADSVIMIMQDCSNPNIGKGRRDELKERYLPDDKDRAHAEAALAWGRGIIDEKGDEMSEYEHNLSVVIAADVVHYKNIGLAASLIAVFNRHLARDVDIKAIRSNEHVGRLKERREFTVSVVGMTPHDGLYGETFIWRFEDEAGNALVWFGSASAAAAESLNVGAKFVIKATVKKHDSYRGRMQTVINRVVVVKKLSVPAQEEGAA